MNRRLPAHLDLIALADTARRVEGRLEVDTLERVTPLLLNREGALIVSLQMGKDEEGIRFLSGSIKGMLVLQCQRCLEAMDFPLDLEFRLGIVGSNRAAGNLPPRYEPLVVTPDSVAVSDVVSDEILLALPIVSRHADAAQCRPPDEQYLRARAPARENPFAILAKLKQDQSK
jgi:uncharacterized protein